MSIFYGDIGDDIAFGIQAIDRPEVANFSASGDHVYFRIFTNNNNIAYTNFANAGLIGSSNYDPTATNRNNLFLGTITNSNVLNKTILIQDNKVGINTTSPQSTLHVVGDILTTGRITSSNITAPTLNGNISFGYSRVLDVESLVVRSNITISLPGANTITNIPTNIVTLSPIDGKILDQYISSNIVRLMNTTGLINPNLLPNINGYQSTSVTNNYLGIGLDNPQQPLHVNGNACITGGRLSIGTITPQAVLHILDDNGPNPTMLLQQNGTVDPLRIVGSNSVPLFSIKSYNSVGIGTDAPSASYALDVHGALRGASLRTGSSLVSDTGTINLGNNSILGIMNLTASNIIVQGTLTMPGTLSTSNMLSGSQISAPTVITDTLTTLTQPYITTNTAVQITGFATGLYSTPAQTFGSTLNPTRIGLSVTNNVIAEAYLSVSDERAKVGITPLDPISSLETVAALSTYEYNLADPRVEGHQTRMAGFLAQEVEQLIPGAVRRTRNAIPSILRHATTSAGGTVLYLTGHGLYEGEEIRLIGCENEDGIVRIARVLSDDIFQIDRPIGPGSASVDAPVFVYGRVVDDFRLLDHERLLPYAFAAIRALQDRIAALEAML